MIRIDFETYSEAGFVWDADAQKWKPPKGAMKKGLPVVGSAAYVLHPTFEVLTMSYNLGFGEQRWKPGDPAPVPLLHAVASGRLVSGWNSGGFEFKVWNWHLVPRFGWPLLRLEQLRDTMADARAHALPGSLDKCGEVLQVSNLKDKDGKRLLDKFSVPRNPTKANPALRIRPQDDPADAENLYAYCDQDVRAEADIAARIPALSEQELAVWMTDRRINDRGVQIDVAGVESCIAIIEQAHEQYNAELCALTGGTVSKASELQKLIAWCGGRGVHTSSLDEENLDGLLQGELPPDVRRALEIRQLVGSASVKKVFAMSNMATSAGRLHDLFLYHAARTGRVTGSGPQPTNLPNSAGVFAMQCESCGKHYGLHRKDCPYCGCTADLAHKVEWCAEAVEDALRTIATCSLGYVEHVWDDAMQAVSGCLRGLFVAGPGRDLLCSDYSAIEAVVVAELAGEEWRREVFRTHGKIYEQSAARISGVPFEEFMRHAGYTDAQLAHPQWWLQKPVNKGSHHPLRKTVGKVAELALGYQGWIGSMLAFGADEFMTEAEMKDAILAWRAASPAIVELWGGQERRDQPVMTGGVPHKDIYGEQYLPSYSPRKELYGIEGAFVYACLNPGAEAWVRGMRVQRRESATGDAVYIRLLSGRELTYHQPRLSPSPRRPGTYSISYEGNNTNPKNGPVGWIRMETWGGRLVENIVQATARDIQWHGILALEAAGYPIVLHVYDEDVAEVPEGFGSVEEFERIMSTMPAWAAGWPIRANGGWRGKRYRKG